MPNKIYKKRVQRIRSKLKKVNYSRFRVSIYRSSKNISAQIIEDVNNKTLVSASSIKEKNLNEDNEILKNVLNWRTGS